MDTNRLLALMESGLSALLAGVLAVSAALLTTSPGVLYESQDRGLLPLLGAGFLVLFTAAGGGLVGRALRAATTRWDWIIGLGLVSGCTVWAGTTPMRKGVTAGDAGGSSLVFGLIAVTAFIAAAASTARRKSPSAQAAATESAAAGVSGLQIAQEWTGRLDPITQRNRDRDGRPLIFHLCPHCQTPVSDPAWAAVGPRCPYCHERAWR